MKVVIIGGSGLIGRKLGAILQAQGHEIVAASPSTGVDSVSGKGVAAALNGADVVIDVANSPSFEELAVLEFFRRSTRNLLSAAESAGVAHYIALSVVGADRLRDNAYLRAKRAQEELIEASGVPYSILRATQFFEFLDAIAADGTKGDVVYLSPYKFQPVAAADVAATLANIATAAPRNGAIELAGPEASSLAEFVQTYLSSKGDARKVIADPDAEYFGAVLDKDGLAPVAQFIVGPTRLADWARAT
ncbi:MAG: SDR family oxidoreductase [Hyphomicrobium sp.]|uniref:SDR family oxidoreductase n=1 Tax=Hyphomicrobium sp. TaxID=82 RepID=UPI003D0C5F93